jgi:phosphohistidine phosphatase SixA
MQLYLVQHGAAKSEAEDPQRSLTIEGANTVERMAKYLSSLRLHVVRIEHSGKERAGQTPANGKRRCFKLQAYPKRRQYGEIAVHGASDSSVLRRTQRLSVARTADENILPRCVPARFHQRCYRIAGRAAYRSRCHSGP